MGFKHPFDGAGFILTYLNHPQVHIGKIRKVLEDLGLQDRSFLPPVAGALPPLPAGVVH